MVLNGDMKVPCSVHVIFYAVLSWLVFLIWGLEFKIVWHAQVEFCVEIPLFDTRYLVPSRYDLIGFLIWVSGFLVVWHAQVEARVEIP